METFKRNKPVQLLVCLCITFMCCSGVVKAQGVKGDSVLQAFPSVLLAPEFTIKANRKVDGITKSKFWEIIESLRSRQHQTLDAGGGMTVKSGVPQEEMQNFSQERPVLGKILREEVTQQQQQLLDQGAENEQFGEENRFYGSPQGISGIDFPGNTSISITRFSCTNVPHDPGMYADEEAGCQIYHLCYSGRRESFPCGVGTLFNQAILNCDFWHKVDCSKSVQFHHLNADFGKSSPEPSSAISRKASLGARRGATLVLPSSLFGESDNNNFSGEQQARQPNVLGGTKGSQMVVDSGAPFPYSGEASYNGKRERGTQISPAASLNQQSSYKQQQQSTSMERTLSKPVLGASLTVIQSCDGQSKENEEEEEKRRKSINQAKVGSLSATSFSLIPVQNSLARKADFSLKGGAEKQSESDEWHPFYKSKSSAPPVSASLITYRAGVGTPLLSEKLQEATSLWTANQESSYGSVFSSISKTSKPTKTEQSVETNFTLSRSQNELNSPTSTLPAREEEAISVSASLATTTTTTTTTAQPSMSTTTKEDSEKATNQAPSGNLAPTIGQSSLEGTSAKDESTREATTTMLSSVDSKESTRIPERDFSSPEEPTTTQISTSLAYP